MKNNTPLPEHPENCKLKKHPGRRKYLIAMVLMLLVCCIAFAKPNEAQAASKPAKVTGVTVSSSSYNTIKISWNKVCCAKKYVVYRSTSKNGTYKKVKTTTSTSWKDTGRTCGKTYYYKVRAYNGKYGSYSSIKSGKAKPNKVSGVSVTSGTNKATISWSKVSGATKYKVYRSTSKSGTYSLVKTTSSTSWTDTSVKNSKTYYYKVRACRTVSGSNIYGSYSSIKKFRSKYASSYQFFLWMSTNDDLTEAQQEEAAAAASILKGTYTGLTNSSGVSYSKLLSYTSLGTGATSLSNLSSAVTMISKGNSYRTGDDNFPGLSSLKVSPILMAIAELDVGYATENTAHPLTFYVGENLAWGYSNPYDGWYTLEKEYYEAGYSSSYTGHYTNLCSSSYTVTGFALTGTTMGQTFCYSSSMYGTTANAYSVSEFKSLISEYTTYINSL